MSNEPVAELTLALLGDPSSFEKMMAAAEARLDKFVAAVDAKGVKLQASVDAMLGKVSASAGKMDAALQPVVTAYGDVALSASVAKAQVAEASAELRGIKDPAGQAVGALRSVGKAATEAGKDVKGGMEATGGAVSQATKKLEGFASFVSRLRASAKAPIVQRVVVQRTGSVGGRGGEGLTTAGYGLMTAGGAILGAEAEMIKSGEGTEDALRRLYATAGETQNYEALRREVLGIATTFGLMPQEVAKALYPIESLGYKGADGLKVLAAAANMAKGTQADLGLTSELVAKTLNLYGQGADHAAHLTDVFTVAIKDAVVPGKDFVPAYSSVMTIAKNAGLSVEETAAALAVMTHNAKSASVGATQLRAFIAGMITPTKAMRDAAKAAGLEWLATGHGADEFKRVGLAGVLDEVMRATNGNISALGDLLPDMRKNQAAMALLNNGGQVFTRTLKDVQNAQGATSKASKEMDQSLAQSGRNMDAALGAASSNLEDAMKPALLSIYQGATNVINAFNRLSPAAQKAIGWVAGVTGGVLLLGGAGLVVTRWVISVADLFARFAVKGVAANAAVAASATETAAAEASVGTAGEASAAQLQAAATGMMTANEEVAAGAGEAATAEAGIGTAATAAGGAGALAFGPASLLMAALLGLGLELYNLKNRWDEMRDSIEQARQKAQDFASQQKSVSQNGELGALAVSRQQIADAKSDLQDQITAQKKQQALIAAAKKRGDTAGADNLLVGMKSDAATYGDTDTGGLGRMIARRDALSRDEAKEVARESQLSHAGVGAGLGASARTGADGFALAVSRVDPTSIITDKVGQTCANFVSKVFQQAGLKIDTINRASDLRDKIVQMGGQEHGGPALPGDLIFYSGPAFTRRRDGSKGSGHVAYADGAGGDWESSRGRTSHKTIEGNLAWAAKHGGGTAQFYTVPGSTFSNPPADAPSAPGGAEPAWARHLHDGKVKKAGTPSAGSLADIDLKPLDSILPLGDLHGAATGAANYEEKLHQLDDALADHDAKMEASGKGYDKYALKIAGLAQRLVLAENAVRNTGQAMEDLSPKVSGEEAKAEGSRTLLNGLSDRMKAQRSAGLPKSDPAAWTNEVRQHEALRAQYNADLEAYRRDDAALKENRRVHSQALEDKDRAQSDMEAARAAQEEKATEQFLKAQSLAVKLGPDNGGISRDQYDKALQDALAGKNKSVGPMNPASDDYARVQDALTQSQIARKAAGDKISRETLQLQKKDFDALEQDLASEVQAYRDAGVAEADILTFRNLKQHEIDMARSAQARKDAVDGGKEMLDLGLETTGQYQQQLGQAIASLSDDWAKAGTDAEKQGFALQIARLRLEISQIDWDAAAKQADGWKQAVDTGKLSTEEYILRLRDLQGQIPATAEEYSRLTAEIDAANKALYDKAEAQAGEVASKATDQLMAVLQKAKTLKAAVRDSLKDAANDALHKSVEDAIKKQVLKIVLDSQADKMKKAADSHKKAADGIKTSGDKMMAAAAGIGRGAQTFQSGVATFAEYVTKFVAATSGGPVKAGSASTDGSGSASPGTGAFGSGDAGSLAAASAGLAGLQSGGAAGGALSALNASGDGGAAGQIGAGLLPDLQKGNDAGAAESGATQAAGMGLLGNTAASVVPYLGAALALFSLFGPTKHTPTFTQNQQYASVMTSFSPTIDSGFSGTDGLRDLLGNTTRAAAGVPAQGQAGTSGQSGHVFNINIAAGAFQGVSDPQGHASILLQEVQTGLAQMTSLDNASRGNG